MSCADRLQSSKRSVPGSSDWRTNLRHGRFQKHLSALTILWAFFSGFEALYSHYKTNFRYKAQWTPVLLTPVLMAAAAGAIKSRRMANTAVPIASALRACRWRRRFLLPCARNCATAWWHEEAALQHALWPADLRAAPVCRLRIPGPDGEPAAPGAQEMTASRFHFAQPAASSEISSNRATTPATAPWTRRRAGTRRRAMSSQSASRRFRRFAFFPAEEAALLSRGRSTV